MPSLISANAVYLSLSFFYNFEGFILILGNKEIFIVVDVSYYLFISVLYPLKKPFENTTQANGNK